MGRRESFTVQKNLTINGRLMSEGLRYMEEENINFRTWLERVLAQYIEHKKRESGSRTDFLARREEADRKIQELDDLEETSKVAREQALKNRERIKEYNELWTQTESRERANELLRELKQEFGPTFKPVMDQKHMDIFRERWEKTINEKND